MSYENGSFHRFVSRGSASRTPSNFVIVGESRSDVSPALLGIQSLEVVVYKVGSQDLDVSKDCVRTFGLKLFKKSSTVRAQFQESVLNEVIEQVGRGVAPSAGCTKSYDRNQAMKPSDKLLPGSGVVGACAGADKLIERG